MADKLIMTVDSGDIVIKLRPDLAPKHVAQITKLAEDGFYDGLTFHRVINGFMAQTGDVKFGNSNSPEYNIDLAGTGGSELPNLVAEFSDVAQIEVCYQWQDHQIRIVQIVYFLLSLTLHLIWIEATQLLEK